MCISAQHFSSAAFLNFLDDNNNNNNVHLSCAHERSHDTY